MGMQGRMRCINISKSVFYLNTALCYDDTPVTDLSAILGLTTNHSAIAPPERIKPDLRLNRLLLDYGPLLVPSKQMTLASEAPCPPPLLVVSGSVNRVF